MELFTTKITRVFWNKHPRTPVLLRAIPEKASFMQRFLRRIGYTTGEGVVIVSEQDYKRLLTISRRKLNCGSVAGMVQTLFYIHEQRQFLEGMEPVEAKEGM